MMKKVKKTVKKKIKKRKPRPEVPKATVRDRHRKEGPVVSQKGLGQYEREAAAAYLLSRRRSHPDIISTLRHQFGMSFSGAKALIHRVYTGFWDNLESAAESIKGRFPTILQGDAVLAGIMMNHAMSLEDDIRIAKDMALDGEVKALTALERLERQYAELFGLLSRGPSVLVGVKADGPDSRVIISTNQESKAKSVMSALTQMTGDQLVSYVIKHLPEHAFRPDERVKQGTKVDALLQMQDEMADDVVDRNIIDADYQVNAMTDDEEVASRIRVKEDKDVMVKEAS